METLTAKIKQMIPDLLIANEVIKSNYQGIIEFEIITHRQELITFLKQAGLQKYF